ncbi:MAG: nucleoside hydrolase [Clostridia bacterium]|nr:nucleoside hydrolase [Clostridia bacterium]
MARKIILDCDPGHDDAIAILLAHAHPAVELLAVTTVAGNQTLPKTTLNARRVMTVAGIRDVPVAAGADRPLVREQVVAADIHGESGLDGPRFGEPTVELDPRHAVDLIIETVLREDDVTLVPVGPLTNIALAIRREPRILPRIREVVLMGGSCTLGNVTPAAEFNIYADPEAAQIVFSSGLPLTMVGLDLTHQVRATPEVVERIRALGNPVAEMAADLLTFFASTYRKVFGFEGAPLHDPCAVAYLIDPQLIECQPANVEVELRGTWTYGATVCDLYGVTGRPANARVATRIDRERFWDLIVEALASYGRAAG